MQSTGDTRGVEHANAMPSGFKYLVGAAALFIAGCSAFFSVRGLGLLFVGSAVAVMIMAASLEIGKLVAASFLYRYWDQISRPLKIYLTLAVIVLIGITSLGNYGYLARAYERTHSRVTQSEEQIAALEKEIADTQRQIDSSRGQFGKATDASRDDMAKLQQRLSEANTALELSLTRVQERRKIAQDRRDRDIQAHSARLAEQAEVLKKAITSEDAALAELSSRVAVLDRAVDAYTKQGGPGFFKDDSIRKGQELRDKQRAEREAITAKVADHQARQERLRTDLGQFVANTDRDITAVREQFGKESLQFDTEEQELRKTHGGAVATAEQQLTAMQSTGKTIVATGDTQVESLYQRIRSRNEEIRHLREQIAGTDIGSYRFVARAFSAQTDSVVKWLIMALVIVFDPLAVSLAVGFNVALLRDRKRRTGPAGTILPDGVTEVGQQELPTFVNKRSRGVIMGTSLIIAALTAGGIAIGAYFGVSAVRQQSRAGHAGLIPSDSFAVVALHPAEIQHAAKGQNVPNWLGDIANKALADALTQLLSTGFDAKADVYAFAKFPTKRENESGERPVMLCGLVARVTDPSAAEATLSRLADQLGASLRTNAATTTALSRSRQMIRFGNGRYMDPEGGFFTFALTDRAAVVMLEVEGDPKSPCVEAEMRQCLASIDTNTSQVHEPLPTRALNRGGALAVWFAADRFFNGLPKNPAAQARFQQLQQFLGFDLVLTVRPAQRGQINVIADYTYQVDRFQDRQQPTALKQLAALGSADQAGLAGRFMDRCADTLDYDSFIERLRTVLGNQTHQGVQDVLVEKTFTSPRAAQFVLTAHYNPEAGAPLVAALNTLWR